jgi:RNA polymerase sigma factor (sigma-70 family)
MDADAVIHVVDDDAAVRDSLAWMIESVGWNVRAYDSAEAFLAGHDPRVAGCLVLDVRMPGMSGLELQRQLAARRVDIPIVFITAHGTVPAAVQALRAGAVDFLMKPFNNEALLARIEQCVEQSRRQQRARTEREGIAERRARLTPREREVMEQVVAGKSNKAVAAALGLSVRTVETHRTRVMEKMNAASLADLVQMALLWRDPAGKP